MGSGKGKLTKAERDLWARIRSLGVEDRHAIVRSLGAQGLWPIACTFENDYTGVPGTGGVRYHVFRGGGPTGPVKEFYYDPAECATLFGRSKSGPAGGTNWLLWARTTLRADGVQVRSLREPAALRAMPNLLVGGLQEERVRRGSAARKACRGLPAAATWLYIAAQRDITLFPTAAVASAATKLKDALLPWIKALPAPTVEDGNPLDLFVGGAPAPSAVADVDAELEALETQQRELSERIASIRIARETILGFGKATAECAASVDGHLTLTVRAPAGELRHLTRVVVATPTGSRTFTVDA